jgi:hypothetical protein
MADQFETLVAAGNAGLPFRFIEKTEGANTYYALEVESGVTLSPTTGTLDAGSVVFADADGNLTEDNPNLFWDDTSNRLHIGARAASTTPVLRNLNLYGSMLITRNGSPHIVIENTGGGVDGKRWRVSTAPDASGGFLFFETEDDAGGATGVQVRIERSGRIWSAINGSGGGLRIGSTSGTDVLLYQSADNELTIPDRVLITSPAAATVPFVVRGFAAQTANLQEWQDSASANPLAVTATRDIIATKGTMLVVGTNDDQELALRVNGVNRWNIMQAASAYAFIPTTTNAHDLGATTNRVRAGHFGTQVGIHSGAAWTASLTPSALNINAVKVIGAQGAAITALTNNLADATVDGTLETMTGLDTISQAALSRNLSELNAKINDLRSRLSTHGLIAA